MMVGRELSAAADLQHILNFDVLLSDRAPDLQPLRPFGLDRRDRQKQRSREIALAADAGLRQRFFGRYLGQTFGEASGGGRLDGDEVNRAGHGRLQPVDRKACDGADAGFAGRQLRPIVLFAGAERGDNAHAGDDDDRPVEFVAWCCHDPPVELEVAN